MVEVNDRLDEEMRQFDQHTGKLNGVTDKLNTVLATAFDKHRAAFVKQQAAHYLSLPTRYLADRTGNETVADWCKRTMGWPEQKDQSGEAGEKRVRILDAIRWYEGVMFWLTIHPVHANRTAPWGAFKAEDSVQGAWKDKLTREEWEDAGAERKPFRVRLKTNAEELATEYAEAVADRLMSVFAYKATSKVLPVLKRNRTYYAGLQKCLFGPAGIEADVRITMPDTRSFVMHVIIKSNTSSLGNPFFQYPLTYHEVYGGVGEPPVKSMSQADLEKMFDVKDEDRWEPVIVAPKRPRWSAAKTGDVVKFQGKKIVGLILGRDKKKKDKLRVHLANGKVVSVPSLNIETVVTRIEPASADGKNFTYSLLNQDWSVDGPVRILRGESGDLEKMYSGKAKGNWKAEVVRRAFVAKYPEAKREAVAA